MPTVEFTRHLHAFFPSLAGMGGAPLEVAGGTVAEVLRALESRLPGIGFYLCDERGRLRQHVNVFIGEQRVKDRATLSDPVAPGSRVFIMQALSGG